MRLALAFFATLAICIPQGHAQVVPTSTDVQRNWEPNRYEVFCGRHGNSSDLRRAQPCMSAGFRHRVRTFLKRGLSSIRALGFRAPKRLGTPKNARNGKKECISVIEDKEAGNASTSHYISPRNNRQKNKQGLVNQG